MTRAWLAGVGALFALQAIAARAVAQSDRSVRVRVTDTTGAPLPGVALTVLDAGGRATVQGRTDTTGALSLRVPGSGVELVAQRIGFLGTRRLLGAAFRDTLALSLAPVAASLDTVRVDERTTRIADQFAIAGNEIDATTKGVFNFWDVLRKLRPGLLDRIGRDVQYKCLPGRVSGSIRVSVDETPIPFSPEFARILADVKSEAIEDLRYVSCFDKSLPPDDYPMLGHIFVTLKRDYDFTLKRGTFKREPTRVSRASTDTATPRVTHARLVGVYDGVTGTPIEGAEVINLLNGYSAITTRTGTVALSFVDSMGALMKIQRVGYAPLVMPMTNLADDLPLTLTLAPRGNAQPRFLRQAGPADTIRKLVIVGFYDRRDTLPATSRAVMDRDQIGVLRTVSGAAAAMQRPLCTQNLFVDAVRVAASARIDELFTPSMLTGIETYLDGEVPGDLVSAASPIRCVTLLWTK